MKKMMTLVLVALVLSSAAGVALAEDSADKPKELDGKDLFKMHCKVCHSEDSDAGEYTPMTYIMEQWEEFFDDLWVETHGEITCPKDDSKKVGDMIDKDMMKKIRKFCVDHAADSEQPMTCG